MATELSTIWKEYTSACATTDMLANTPHSALSEAQRLELVKHLANCANCRTELALWLSFQQAQPRRIEAADVAWIVNRLHGGWQREEQPSAAWWQKMFRIPTLQPVLAVAAVMLMMVSISVWKNPGEPRLAVSEETTMRSSPLTVLSPAGDLEASPSRMEWTPVAGAVRYDVQLMEVDRSVVWSSSSPAAAIAIPMEVQLKLRSGSPYLWQVEAIQINGQRLAVSSVAEFRLR